MNLSGIISISCGNCGQTFTWNLADGPLSKSFCPYCEGSRKITDSINKKDKNKKKEKRRKKKKKKYNLRTKEEKYPANLDCPDPTYPLELFISEKDFYCRSINEYYKSPRYRKYDIDAVTKALEKLNISRVKRVEIKVKVTIISYRFKLMDTQSLYGGGSKGLLDTFVRFGWLYDDSPKWCELKIEQEQVLKKDLEAGKERGTYILLERL